MKRLIFCFDGSWNRLDAKNPTNVVLTAESVEPLASDGTAQVIFYDEGVGTGKGERWRGGIFGRGLDQNLADAYRFLIFNHTPGDEIYIFGFSRGAYTARSFAGLLRHCGVALRRHAARIGEAIERYKTRTESAESVERMLRFRQEISPHICVSDADDVWRKANNANYVSIPRFRIQYVGVWDTVGALGIPTRYRWFSAANRKYQFHDTNLSSFVRSARHAVAIDERRKDFQPTLWTNLTDLNRIANKADEAEDAPFQQKWFPGIHGAVGGGGDRRGLSDQALEWVLDGARNAGLELDASEHSQIFGLAPDDADFLKNSSSEDDLMTSVMNKFIAADRDPGPEKLFEVSVSAQRRWVRTADQLPEKQQYRPKTLNRVRAQLDKLDAVTMGVDSSAIDAGKHRIYVVKRKDTLRGLAKEFYGDANAASRIFDANRNKLLDPDRIYPGMSLRIP